MINQIDALRSPGGIGGADPLSGGLAAGLGGAGARCQHCKDQRETLKAKLDPVGEMARDTMRAKKADLASKISLLKGDVLGAMFYGQMSQRAQREMGLNVAANLTGGGGLNNGLNNGGGFNSGLGGMNGLGLNPLLG